MTTSDDQQGGHWFQRCNKAVQDWLLSDPDAALTTTALDAVIGAGGMPVRRRATEDNRSEAYYLHPADTAYLADLRAAGYGSANR